MADTTYTDGETSIDAEWLNEINEFRHRGGPTIKTLYEAEADTNAFTDAEETKLAGIEAAATADQTGAEIKTAYEAEANTNAFTDAEKTQLSTNTSNISANTTAISENAERLYGAVVAGGTVDALTADFTPNITLTDGMLVVVRAAGANATATPTFAPDGLTARTIRKNGGRALVSGDIEGADHELLLKYNLTNTEWELLNPARPDCVVEHEVTGSAVTSIDFTGLDINTDKSYRIELDITSITAGAVIELFYNNDTTSTNYYSQYIQGSGATPTSSRANDAGIIAVGAGTFSSCVINVQLVDGYAIAVSSVARDIGASVIRRSYAQGKSSATLANITQMTLTANVASIIDVATKTRIYRG